jgi:quinol monooxygenase YgiN
MFGLFGKLTAKPRWRDALVEVLLEASRGVAQVDGCHLYVVSTSPDDPDSAWVFEVWETQEAHAASLQLDTAQSLIKRALPLLTGPPESGHVLSPVGGLGLAPVSRRPPP